MAHLHGVHNLSLHLNPGLLPHLGQQRIIDGLPARELADDAVGLDEPVPDEGVGCVTVCACRG